MSSPDDARPAAPTPTLAPGRHRSAPTSTTLDDRGAGERAEWATAGEVATGLNRARIALALAASWSRHAAAEGASY